MRGEGKEGTMSLHVLEKLAATTPDCEIWWDSSPLVCEGWKAAVPMAAPTDKRAYRYGEERGHPTRHTVDFVAQSVETLRRRAA